MEKRIKIEISSASDGRKFISFGIGVNVLNNIPLDEYIKGLKDDFKRRLEQYYDGIVSKKPKAPDISKLPIHESDKKVLKSIFNFIETEYFYRNILL